MNTPKPQVKIITVTPEWAAKALKRTADAMEAGEFAQRSLSDVTIEQYLQMRPGGRGPAPVQPHEKGIKSRFTALAPKRRLLKL